MQTNKTIQKPEKGFKKSTLSSIPLRKIVSLVSFRGMGVLFQMLMQFAIARIAGPAGLGIMQLYQTWSCVLGEVSAAGLPTQTMKSISTSNSKTEIKKRLSRSLLIIIQFWLIAVFLIFLITRLPSGSIVMSWLPFSTGGQFALLWSILCFAILRLSAEALKAMDRAGEAVFAENSLLPLAMLIYCICIALGLLTLGASTEGNFINTDALIYAATGFLTIAATYSLTRSYIRISCLKESSRKVLKRALKETGRPAEVESVFTPETRYFWGSSVINIGFLSMPFLLMPYFGDLVAIGLFTLAFKLINPITTILGMLNALFCPRFAKAASKGSVISKAESTDDSKELSKLLIQSQFLSVALYLPLLVPILLFAEPVLTIFGEEFAAAKPYLFVLAGAQLFNALTGLSGNMLNMIGMGKREFQGAVLFFVIGLISGIFCGQEYGLMGVAIAYSLALAGKNIWSYSFALAHILRVKTPNTLVTQTTEPEKDSENIASRNSVSACKLA